MHYLGLNEINERILYFEVVTHEQTTMKIPYKKQHLY